MHDLVMKRLLDGQFEESLSNSLIALFNARIKYPEIEPPANALWRAEV